MLQNYEYEQALFGLNQRWLFGHPTEHILPDDLHEELLLQEFPNASPAFWDKLRQMHQFNSKIIQKNPIRILVHESAYKDFTVMGTLDFYGHKVYLTINQRLRYIRHLYDIIQNKNQLELKSVRSGMIDDLQHIPDPTLLLSDAYCYMSLDSNTAQYNLTVPNKVGINNIFRTFFDDLWDKIEYNENESNPYSFVNLLRHIVHSIELMSDNE